MANPSLLINRTYAVGILPSAERSFISIGVQFSALRAENCTQKSGKYHAAAGKSDIRCGSLSNSCHLQSKKVIA